MGPLAMGRQLERVQGYTDAGKAEGATIATGGGRPEGLDTGFFIEPTVFTDVTPDMRIAREEIFGPVVSIITYKDDEDAIAKANDTDYGLNGAIFSTDSERAYKMARPILHLSRSGRIAAVGRRCRCTDRPPPAFEREPVAQGEPI